MIKTRTYVILGLVSVSFSLLLSPGSRAQSPALADIPALLQQLENSDSTVRGSAAMQLDSIRDPAALPALLDAFRTMPKQRSVLLRALAHFKDARKIPVFVDAVRKGDPEFSVWSAIVLQLKELGEPAAHALMDSAGHSCTQEYMVWVGSVLAEFDEVGVHLALLGLANQSDECLRGAGESTLMTYFPPGGIDSSPESDGIPLLTGAAQSKNLAIRLVGQEWIQKNLNTPIDKLDFRTILEPLFRTYSRAQKVATKLAVLEVIADYNDARVGQLMLSANKSADLQLHAFAAKWLAEHPAPLPEVDPVTMPAGTLEEKLAKLKGLGEKESAEDTGEAAKYLADQDPRVREAAAIAIGRIDAASTDFRGHDERERDTDGANAALAPALHDADAHVRAAVLAALGLINNSAFQGGDSNEITPKLVSLAKDPDGQVQSALARSLGQIADPAAVPTLIELSASSNLAVRQDAAEALIRFSTPQAACAKFSLLRDSDAAVRASAATGIFDGVPEGVRCRGDVEALIAALQDPVEHDWVRLPLGKMRDRRAVGPLLADLKAHGEPHATYCHDCQALTMIADPSIIEPLTPLLADHNPVVANGVAQTIASIKDPKSVAVLSNLLRDDRAEMRVTALKGLTGFGQCQLAPEFRRYLTDDAEGVRAAAADAAAKCKDKDAVDPLIALLNIQPLPAAAALGQLGDMRAVPPLLDALKQKDLRGRSTIVHALGQIHDTRAVDALIAQLHDDSSQQYMVIGEAAWALAQIGDRRAIPALQQIVSQAGPGAISYVDDATKALQKFGATVPIRGGR